MKKGDKILCKRDYYYNDNLVLELGKYYDIIEIIYKGKGIIIDTGEKWIEYDTLGRPNESSTIILYIFKDRRMGDWGYKMFNDYF